MSNRFKYVKYNEDAIAVSEQAKVTCEYLERLIMDLGAGREQSLALTHLEETFMWLGKALKEKMIQQNSKTEHLPERSES